MSLPTVDQLLDQTIAAYKAGDIAKASESLALVIKLDSNNERAWLWLSGVVNTDAERLFCVKRILAINPQSPIAQRGLALLPPDLEPVQPSLDKPKEWDAEVCTFPGCHKPVARAGYKFCYKHWKAVNAPLEPIATLNSTALGERLNMSSRRTNLVLAELGWVSKERRGWAPTKQAIVLGAVQKEHHQTGVPFVVWPETILSNKALLATINELAGEMDITSEKVFRDGSGFREKFTPTHRATDGHWVRSKAEMLIDNWLYMSGIAHAYERRIPIEEELYCDFYIPAGKVYIEYWGLDNDPKYIARKNIKLELYRKHSLNLVEITEEHMKNLDDVLPKLLLKFNVTVG